MEIQYFGANCVRITTKHASVVVDDTLSQQGLKSITKPSDIVLATILEGNESQISPQLRIDRPGEYEVSGVAILGIAARAHTDEEGKKTATIFKLTANDIRLCIAGHIYPDLSDDQLELIGTVDVLVVPVGGNGYTLDATGALKVIKKIEPKVVIPVHYADSKIRYEVPQASLADALQNMAVDTKDTLPKLKLKNSELPANMELIVLDRN